MIKGKMTKKIIDRDAQGLQWIRDAVEQQGRFPTVRELQRAMGLSSTSQAAALLDRLKVRGESMINAGILPQDTVLLEQTSTVENGEIAAVLLEEEATLKRVYREDGRIRLQPENDGMEPIYTQDCRILGRLIGLVRSYE